jgi:hypothetical protein
LFRKGKGEFGRGGGLERGSGKGSKGEGRLIGGCTTSVGWEDGFGIGLADGAGREDPIPGEAGGDELRETRKRYQRLQRGISVAVRKERTTYAVKSVRIRTLSLISFPNESSQAALASASDNALVNVSRWPSRLRMKE